MLLNGTDLFLFINSVKVGFELSHTLSRKYNFINKTGRLLDREIIMTDKEGVINLTYYVEINTAQYVLLIDTAENQTLSTFDIKTDATNAYEFNFQGYIVAFNQEATDNNVVRIDMQIVISGAITITPPQFFSSLWNTVNTSTGSSASKEIQLPLISTGIYNFVVDWGDGTQDTITTWNQAETLHTYTSSGTKAIRITGTIEGWQFNNTGDRNKIISISDWGSLTINNSRAFFGCQNLSLTGVVGTPTFNITTLGQMFRNCTNLTTINGLENWDVSGVTDFSNFWNGCTNFNDDLSSWNVSSATNMSSMFSGATAYNNGGQPLSDGITGWDTSSVTGLGFRLMFLDAQSFNQDISGFNVSGATNLQSMLDQCDVFNQDISGWDVSSVTSFFSMLSNAFAFNQNLGSWDLTNANNMTDMLNNCGMNTANYDSTLVGWELPTSGTTPNGITIGASGLTYTSAGAGGTARTALINDHSWSFVGDSGV